MTRCDGLEARKFRSIDYFLYRTSRLLDLSLIQINFGGSISRARKESLQVDLVCPSSNDVGPATTGHAMNELLLTTAVVVAFSAFPFAFETAKLVGQAAAIALLGSGYRDYEMSNRRGTACC